VRGATVRLEEAWDATVPEAVAPALVHSED
jgi:hypothetical protein